MQRSFRSHQFRFEVEFAVLVSVNDSNVELPDAASIRDLLDRLQVTVRHVAVEVNGELVPRLRHAEHRLADGDRVEVVTLVGGG